MTATPGAAMLQVVDALPSGNTQALPGISLLGQTGRNVYSLLAEQPLSPPSRCAFWFCLSGHFLSLVTKKKSFIYCICRNIFYLFLQSYNFCSLWERKRSLYFEWEQCLLWEKISVNCAVFVFFFASVAPAFILNTHSVTKSGYRKDYLLWQ